MARVLRKGEERQLRQKEGTMYTCQKGKNLCVEKTVLSFDGFIEGWAKICKLNLDHGLVNYGLGDTSVHCLFL
jgi:hypothetical protein